MNRHLIIYLYATLLLVGCSEKYDEGLGMYPTLSPRYMTITPTALTYASSPETKTINITSIQTPWKIENGIDWISTSPTSGSTSATLSVGVTENKSGDDARTGIFYLKADVNDWRYEAPITDCISVELEQMIALSAADTTDETINNLSREEEYFEFEFYLWDSFE